MKTFWCLLITAVCATGCHTPQARLLSPGEAINRAEVNRIGGPKANGEVRLELPAVPTGTGTHDFYNLFAEYHVGHRVRFGLSLATTARHTDEDTTVLVNGLGLLPISSRMQVKVWPYGRVNYLELRLDHEFVTQSAASGRHFTLHGGPSGTQEFAVPEWMFAALLEATDRRLPEMRALSFNVQEVMQRSDLRRRHVELNPSLPVYVREAILLGEVTVGMTVADVLASQGEPEITTRTRDKKGEFEVWRYPGGRLMFEQGLVTGWDTE